MALLETYNINAMATQISREFYINENNHADDKSYILMDEMRLFAMIWNRELRLYPEQKNRFLIIPNHLT